MKQYWCGITSNSLLGHNRFIKLINSFIIILFIFSFIVGVIYGIGWIISIIYVIKVDEYWKGYFMLGVISFLHYLIVLIPLGIFFSIAIFPFHRCINYKITFCIILVLTIPISIFGIPLLGIIRTPFEFFVCDKKHVLNEICFINGFINLTTLTAILTTFLTIILFIHQTYKSYKKLYENNYEISYNVLIEDTTFKEILIK